MNTQITDLAKVPLRDMKIGDAFFTRGVFGGVSSENLKWEFIESNYAKADMIFEVTYFGIFVGKYCLNPAYKGKVVELQ